jgi:glycogen debranching enzyme
MEDTVSYSSNSYLTFTDTFSVDPIKLRRTRAKFILGAKIEISSYETNTDANLLKGLPAKLVELRPVDVYNHTDHEGPYSEIMRPGDFPPGSVMVFETQIEDFDADLEEACKVGAYEALKDVNLVDLNVILHRADVEERDATGGSIGAYDVPNHGKMVYCGLEGWMHPLRHIMKHNDLGHPLCAHLREGSWAFDYLHQRLTSYVSRSSTAHRKLILTFSANSRRSPISQSLLNGSKSDAIE